MARHTLANQGWSYTNTTMQPTHNGSEDLWKHCRIHLRVGYLKRRLYALLAAIGMAPLDSFGKILPVAVHPPRGVHRSLLDYSLMRVSDITGKIINIKHSNALYKRVPGMLGVRLG